MQNHLDVSELNRAARRKCWKNLFRGLGTALYLLAGMATLLSAAYIPWVSPRAAFLLTLWLGIYLGWTLRKLTFPL